MSNVSRRLNRSNHFWSSSAILWSVDTVAGRLEEAVDEALVDLSDLTDLDDDFLSSTFFFSAGYALKLGNLTVPWPSTTPTTDTCAGSTRVGLRVTESASLLGVEVDLASLFSFLSLQDGVESCARWSEVKMPQNLPSRFWLFNTRVLSFSFIVATCAK